LDALLFCCVILQTPVFLGLAYITLVAALSSSLTCIVKLLSLGGSSLLQREEANLALQEVLELIPVGLFAIQLEGVLTFFGQSRIVAPQLPVTTLYSLSLLCLALTHTALSLKTVVDTGSVSDYD